MIQANALRVNGIRDTHWRCAQAETAEHSFRMGVECCRRGQWRNAEQHYRQAIAYQPERADLYFRLGLILDQQGRLADAVESYQQAIARIPHYLDATINLGCALLKQGEIDAAIDTFQRAIARYPKQASLHNNLGRALQANGEIDGAIAHYQQAIQCQPDLVRAHVNLACLWQQQGDRERAIAQWRRVVQLDPDNVEAYSRLGQLQLDRGDVAAAMTCWQRVIQLQPQWVRAFVRRIAQLEPKDDLDRTQHRCAEFLMALSEDAQSPNGSALLAQTYSQLGQLVMDYGGLEQADPYFRKALHLQPHHLERYLQLGHCLTQQRRLDAALVVYHLALTQFPHKTILHNRISHILEHPNLKHPNLEHPNRLSSAPLPHSPTPPLPHSPTPYPSTHTWTLQTSLPGVRYIDVPWNRESPSPQRLNGISEPGSETQSLPEISSPATGVGECGGVTCAACMARLRSEFEPIQMADRVFQCTRRGPIPVEPFSTFVVTIPHGRAWIAPQQNSWMICNSLAIATPDGALLGDLSRDYPWYLPGCDRHHPSNHRLFQLDTLPPVERLRGRVAVLSGLSGHVYYHWMMDVLPRFELLRRSGVQWDDLDYVVVNDVNASFQRETLEKLGVPLDKVIASDRHPHIQADQLIVPSFPGHLDWVPEGTLTFLRQVFLPDANRQRGVDSSQTDAPVDAQVVDAQVKGAWRSPQRLPKPTPKGTPEYLYISRAQARYRQVINEDEILAYLRPLGVVPVVLETLTVAQQVALFAQARLIIAPHGAGLTNLSFCQPGTSVVELVSPYYMRTDYWIISHHLGLNHYVIRGRTFDSPPLRQLMYQNPLTEDIDVPLSSLKALLPCLLPT